MARTLGFCTLFTTLDEPSHIPSHVRQGQGLGLVAEEVGEWTGKGAVVLNESTVEVRESQESLEFLDGGRFRPGLDSFHLPLVHPDATTVNMITEELYGGLVERTLLCLEKELILT